ncbi:MULTISPECIES: TonB-dependent receptor domain-containing protein [unclassified Alishewanella]|uniref:TonB-dependent receptor domain-containing protein n=1 Tax=unclassified Alishewanella TaxID=2628974 RepID=UPI00082358CE|nr:MULTISPECIES: TonB-dependent receptor [unclassified Alishewanella]MCT8126694.1 TonB-dependent receptor [Alishewanella sp. BS5-314]OCW97675.1 TonB-dependent receptor [Alishewanella sp. HH-ZS]
MLQFRLAAPLLLTLCSATTMAESVERINIHASRTALAEADVLASISVLEREDILARQAADLPALLAQLPGINLSRDGGRGQSTGLYLRGGNTGYTLVLIDGVRAGSATTGAKALSMVPLELIERIEVIRGPRAAWYGADALAGVIVISTRQGQGAELQLNAGSYGQAAADLALGQQFGALQLNSAFGYSRADGFDVRDGLDPDRDGYQQRFAKFAAALTTVAGDFNAQFDINSGTYQYDTAWGSEDQGDVLHRSYILGWQYAADQLQQQAQLSRSLDDETSFGPDSRSPFVTEREEFNYQANLALSEALNWLAGVNWYSEDVQRSGVGYLESRRINQALFSGVHLKQDSWLLEGSARRDLTDQYGANNTWQLAAGYRFAEHWLVRTSRGAAFKAPTFNDLYYPGSGNAELAPERSVADEIALSYQVANGSFELAWFETQVQDLIQFDMTSFRPENISRARLSGVEFAVTAELGSLTQQLAYTLLNTKNQLSGQRLVRRPKHTLHWRLEQQWQALSAFVTADYQSDTYQGDFASRSELGGFTLWGLGLAYQLQPALTLRAKVDNLLDKQYQTSDGYNTAGVNLNLSLQYRLF